MPRKQPSVPLPQHNLPTDEQVWESPSVPNIEFLKHHFFMQGKLTPTQLTTLTLLASTILRNESNLLTLQSPITICGDIHGQYYDLMRIFEMVGGLTETFGTDRSLQMLFLGDYVDRGMFSVECYMLLLALKIRYPQQFWLLRGNHECRHLTAYFTFKRECSYKYNEECYKMLCDSFDCLPLAAVVDGKLFCVHGGISPSLDVVQQVNMFDRFRDPPKRTLFCDLLWADPHEQFGNEMEKALFSVNRVRGCSYSYSYAAVCEFLEKNNLLCLVRGHEAQENGYKLYRKRNSNGFPSVVTLFSAPNYVDTYGNKAALLRFDGKLFFIKQFTHAPHPYILPNFIDAITWSSGFVAEKLVEILAGIINVSVADDKEADREASRKLIEEGMEKRKKKAVDKMRVISKLHGKLMQARKSVEGMCEFIDVHSQLASASLSSSSSESLEQQVAATATKEEESTLLDVAHFDAHSFVEARLSDLINEKLPATQAESASLHPDPAFDPLTVVSISKHPVLESPTLVMNEDDFTNAETIRGD